MTPDQLFKRWQNLDKEERRGILPPLFGVMGYLLLFGTEADKAFAERFFVEVETLIEEAEVRL